MRKFFIAFLLIPAVYFSQQTETIDFKKVNAFIEIIPSEKKVAGKLEYRFVMLKNADSVFLDAKNMTVSKIKSLPAGISLRTTEDKIWIRHSFRANREYRLTFEYEAFPSQAMYFFRDQVWTQGQGKYTSHWLPSIDDVKDKIIFNFSIKAPEQFTVLANGKLHSSKISGDKKTWDYKMQKPMSSYLAALVVGPFMKTQKTSAPGVPLENYIFPEDSLKAEPTYRYTKQIFDFLESETGVVFPWQNYKQVPVRDFLYAGMENTTLTIFSQAFVVDSTGFIDRNYVNVNAHELAHQWFGNLVTAEESKHHWLQEGFSTYYALLAEREIFGEDYFYWKLYESANQLKELSDAGKGEAVLDPKASSLTFYQKGAWALYILQQKIGRPAFQKAVKNYLETYGYATATTDDFLQEAEKASGKDLKTFKAEWLEKETFNYEEALSALAKSDMIRSYLELVDMRTVPFSSKKEFLSEKLKVPVNDYLGQEAVYQLGEVPFFEAEELYVQAFLSENLLVRQAIAVSVNDIPEKMRPLYETLLTDDSYLTKELALYNLWMNFPQGREKYLDTTRSITGFADKNIRTLWLALALATEGFSEENKDSYFKELTGYTSEAYSFEIRQNAFQYIFSLGLFTDANLKDLVDASLHPNWRFAQSSRRLLEELLKDENIKARLLSLRKELPERQAEWLTAKIESQ